MATLSDEETKKSTLEGDEVSARKNAAHSQLYLLLVNGYSAIFVFVFHLISLESLISIGLSVGLTIYTYDRIKDNASFDGNTMNWVLLSFAVVTPIGSALAMVFSRRESALQLTATLRSLLLELYTSHAIWGWDYTPGELVKNGRSKSMVNWLEHTDDVCLELFSICDDLTRLLTLPNGSRARHKITGSGKKEATRTHAVHMGLTQSIVIRFGRLAELCEVLKREGLPPNESNRIRQWERSALEAIERLRVIKLYRTPQGLRSFARLFSLFLPPFYSPYYAQLAHDLNSLGTAIAFSVFTALALTALFETISQLEDPFIDSSVLDGLDVKNDLIDDFKPSLLALRQRFFPACRLFGKGHVAEAADPYRNHVHASSTEYELGGPKVPTISESE